MSQAAAESRPRQNKQWKARSRLDKERDLARIDELHLKGLNSREIAQRLDLNMRQVLYDLQELGRRYANALGDKLQRQLNRQLAKLDLLEREAWQAYEASKSSREIKISRRRTRDDSTMNEAAFRTEQREGDVRKLMVIQWCIAERNRLLGLYAPEEARITGQLHTVNEIVYELPPNQNVPQLKLLPAKDAVLPAQPRTEIIEVSPSELWGNDDEGSETIEQE